MDDLKVILDKARRELDKVPILNTAEDATGLDKLIIVGVVAGLAIFVLYFGFGASFCVNLVGFVYPAYQSFLAIEGDGQSATDATQWLVYWVVYSAFSIIESFSDLVFTWIPMYFPFKIAFLCWCFLPQTRGAHVLYNNFLKDFLKAHESAIDAQINRLSGGLVAAGKDD